MNGPQYSYDIVLDFGSNRNSAIYHAVTIEMYYNFYYAVKEGWNYRSKDFKFTSIWCRGAVLTSSSLSVIILRHRKKSKYENIVIVHNTPPPGWGRMHKEIEESTNIIWFAPPEFVLWNHGTPHPVELTDSRMAHMVKRRDLDSTFTVLVDEFQNLPKWPTFGNFRWSYLTNSSLYSIENEVYLGYGNQTEHIERRFIDSYRANHAVNGTRKYKKQTDFESVAV